MQQALEQLLEIWPGWPGWLPSVTEQFTVRRTARVTATRYVVLFLAGQRHILERGFEENAPWAFAWREKRTERPSRQVGGKKSKTCLIDLVFDFSE
jgi:hypothetical protein